jgi:hypothetical protein
MPMGDDGNQDEHRSGFHGKSFLVVRLSGEDRE